MSDSGQAARGETPLLNLRVPRSVQDYLSARAREQGVTRSDLVRTALQTLTPAELWHEHPESSTPGRWEAARVSDAAPPLSVAGGADAAG